MFCKDITIQDRLLDEPTINVDIQGRVGKTALIYLCEDFENGAINLLEKRPNIDINAQGTDGNTALIEACKNNHADIALKLLNLPTININKENNDDKTALNFSIENNLTTVTNRLTELGAKKGTHVNVIVTPTIDISLGINDINDSHDTVGIENAIEIIKNNKQNVDKLNFPDPDANGITPLIKAVSKGYLEIVKALLETKKVDVNAADKDGQTALFYALSNGSYDISFLLLNESSLDINVKTNVGTTYLEVSDFNSEIKKRIEDRMVNASTTSSGAAVVASSPILIKIQTIAAAIKAALIGTGTIPLYKLYFTAANSLGKYNKSDKTFTLNISSDGFDSNKYDLMKKAFSKASGFLSKASGFLVKAGKNPQKDAVTILKTIIGRDGFKAIANAFEKIRDCYKTDDATLNSNINLLRTYANDFNDSKITSLLTESDDIIQALTGIATGAAAAPAPGAAAPAPAPTPASAPAPTPASASAPVSSPAPSKILNAIKEAASQLKKAFTGPLNKTLFWNAKDAFKKTSKDTKFTPIGGLYMIDSSLQSSSNNAATILTNIAKNINDINDINDIISILTKTTEIKSHGKSFTVTGYSTIANTFKQANKYYKNLNSNDNSLDDSISKFNNLFNSSPINKDTFATIATAAEAIEVAAETAFAKKSGGFRKTRKRSRLDRYSSMSKSLQKAFIHDTF